VADGAFGEFRRMLEYKAQWYGATVVVANRFYPSSKTCSDCGVIHPEVVLGVDKWHCDDCGADHDRDLNASINLRNMAESFAVTACGERSADAKRKPRVKLRSVKQEDNLKLKAA
jgi:putative transposase